MAYGTVCAALQEVDCLKAELQVVECRLKSCDPVQGTSGNDRERCVL